MTQPTRHRTSVNRAPGLEAPREHLTLLPPPPSEPLEGLPPPLPMAEVSWIPEMGAAITCENDVDAESSRRPTDVDARRWWEEDDAVAMTERQPRITRDWGAS